MYAASSSVSAPPRPLRPRPSDSGPYLAPARPANPVLGAGNVRRTAGPGTQPLSGRLDLSGPQGAQLRTAEGGEISVVDDFGRIGKPLERRLRSLDRARLAVVITIVNASGEVEQLRRRLGFRLKHAGGRNDTEQ